MVVGLFLRWKGWSVLLQGYLKEEGGGVSYLPVSPLNIEAGLALIWT